MADGVVVEGVSELWELVGRTAGEEVGEEKEIFLGTHFGLGAGESANYFLPASLALLVLDTWTLW